MACASRRGVRYNTGGAYAGSHKGRCDVRRAHKGAGASVVVCVSDVGWVFVSDHGKHSIMV